LSRYGFIGIGIDVDVDVLDPMTGGMQSIARRQTSRFCRIQMQCLFDFDPDADSDWE